MWTRSTPSLLVQLDSFVWDVCECLIHLFWFTNWFVVVTMKKDQTTEHKKKKGDDFSIDRFGVFVRFVVVEQQIL